MKEWIDDGSHSGSNGNAEKRKQMFGSGAVTEGGIGTGVGFPSLRRRSAVNKAWREPVKLEKGRSGQVRSGQVRPGCDMTRQPGLVRRGQIDTPAAQGTDGEREWREVDGGSF